MRKPTVSVVAAALLVAGCTLAPRYQRPASPAAPVWPQSTVASDSSRLAAEIGWRDFFRDERLQKVVAQALANNRDLRISSLNVEQVQAQYRIQRAALLPAINAAGGESRSRTPGTLTSTGRPAITDTYSASVGATSYELDLFGRVRSLKNRALETYLSSEEARRSAQLSLVAEVSVQYLTLCALSEQLRLAENTLAAVSSGHELMKRSFELGNASELDYQSTVVQVQSARASVANYRQQLEAASHALAVLVGSALPADLPVAAPLDSINVFTEIAAGVPSEVLLRRPDILAAEHTLKAANANIGAARAAFFPRITLTGSMGTASTELSGLFKEGAETWSFSPSITLPIFAGGANKASLDAAQIAKRIEIARYEKAIQTAFKEASDALTAGAPLEERLDAYVQLVAAQQKRFALAEARYKHGVDSYLAVLTSQQDLYSAQQTLISVRLARLTNRITLYKTLGGGWQ